MGDRDENVTWNHRPVREGTPGDYLAFYLPSLNNVTYKHVVLKRCGRKKQTNKQTNNPRGNTHFCTDEQTRFMLNQLLLLLVVVKRSSGKGCITTSCNKNSATYRIGYDMLSANDSIYSLPCILGVNIIFDYIFVVVFYISMFV